MDPAAIHQATAQAGGEEEAPRGESAAPSPLTARQMQIMRYVAQGRTNKQIARTLGIGWKTVRNHLVETYGRLRVQSRTEAVWVLRERGWL